MPMRFIPSNDLVRPVFQPLQIGLQSINMYLMICFCFSALAHLPSTAFAESMDFKIRSRYDDNDYSVENRDVIEGFRTTFVPPKWERVIDSSKRKHECDRLAAALVDDENLILETTQVEDCEDRRTSTPESVGCTSAESDYEDVEEKVNPNEEISTSKTTKKDYVVIGIVMHGGKLCGSTAVTPNSAHSKHPVANVKTASTVLKDDATTREEVYDDHIYDDSTVDTDSELEHITEDKNDCRRDEFEITDVVQYEKSTEDSKLTKCPITPKPSSKTALSTKVLPKVASSTSCAAKDVLLKKPHVMSQLAEDPYVDIIISEDSENANKMNRIKTENIANELRLMRNKHAKQKQLAKGRRFHKRMQKHYVHSENPIESDYFNLQDDLSIPYTDQLLHKTAINSSNIPSAKNVDLRQTISMKYRLHENFWLQNEDEARVREIHAGNMKKYMDFNVNPCDDFYRYACGNWHKYNPVPDNRNNYDTFDLLRDSLDYILKDLLEDKEIDRSVNAGEKVWKGLHPVYRTKSRRNNVPDFYDADEDLYFLSSDHRAWDRSPEGSPGYNENTVEATTKAKYFYSSCMNREMLEKRGIQPAVDLLSKLGGWPLLDPNWKAKGYEFEWLVAQLRLYNNDILLSEWVSADVRDSMRYIIQIDQTTLGLPSRGHYLEPGNQAVLAAYQKYIMAIGLQMGANETTIARDALEIVSFEIELASITESSASKRNVSEIYIRLTVNELRRLVPQFNWLRYFRLISDNYVQADDEVVLYCMRYIRRLVNLISRTNIRTTTNYLLWRFMRHRVNNLDDRFQVARQRFNKVVFGRDYQPPRWQNCVLQINSNMGPAVGKLFVSKYYPKQSKADTLHMTEYIREAFAEILKDTIWLDPITKHLALIKLAAMRLKIGYPNYILNRRKLNKHFSDLQIHPAYYFENTITILQSMTRLEHHKLKRQVKKNVWNLSPAIVNAFYSRNKNEMIFAAGMLQPPFYHRHFPRAMNFGGIGVVMGHEITHGFDDKGRLFDKEGNLKNWWKHESVKEFRERTHCLIEQYKHYLIPEVNMRLNGVTTQGENIADNGGLKQAFLAYQYWLKDNENKVDSELMPGLNVTNLQLFFLNFAQIWCSQIRPGAARTNLHGSLHSPGRFRVIGPVSNSEEFAEVFNCKAQAPMNPDEKCTIWQW